MLGLTLHFTSNTLFVLETRTLGVVIALMSGFGHLFIASLEFRQLLRQWMNVKSPSTGVGQDSAARL